MLLLEKEHHLDKNIFLVSGDKALTYEDVFSLGEGVFDNKIKEVVLILCDRNVDIIIAYVAALRNNKVPLLIDCEYRCNLINEFIGKYEPSYIISGNSFECDPLDYESRSWRSLKINVHRLEKKYIISDELSLLMPTSGSTGDPKCVRFSSKNIDSCISSICEYLEYDSSRISISLLPIHYSYGLSVLHNCIYVRGAFVVSKSTFLDKDFFDIISRYGVTDISGVPFLMNIMRKLKLDFEKMKSLKCVTQAGGYFPIKDAYVLYKSLGSHNIKYFTMYGQTEASPRISYLPPEYFEEKQGSVGIPISCGTLSIDSLGFNDGAGELIYKGENVALGYANGSEDLIEGDVFKGVLKTGDIAKIDDDGFVTILGRCKRFVKISGVSINLDSIEKKILESFPETVVIGKDDKVVILTRSQQIESVRSFFQATYGFNKTTFKVKSLDLIPLNSSGKTDYKYLTVEYL